MTANRERVTVVGAGMAGAACAAALHRAGVTVRWCDRAAGVGGRMASPVVHGRRVDIGASYFTVRDEGFAAVVEGWAAAGLARPWTDTFAVLAPGEAPTTATGPLRWSAPGGLQSLVQAVASGPGGPHPDPDPGGPNPKRSGPHPDPEPGGPDLEVGRPIEALPAGNVVLAMPDPEAARLVEVPDPVGYHPAIAVVCGFDERRWPFRDGAFVNGHAAIEFLADDGARRGDGAPILVAHTTAVLAHRHPMDPSPAADEVLASLGDLLGLPRPEWATAHRWAVAKPAGGHSSTFTILETDGGRLIGLAGDQWCGSGPPRVESAWRSGTDLAAALLDRLGVDRPGEGRP